MAQKDFEDLKRWAAKAANQSLWLGFFIGLLAGLEIGIFLFLIC